MPVVIVVDSEPVIGPGSRFSLTTDFVGPIPLDYQWELVIVDGATDHIAWSSLRPALGAFTVGGNVADLDGLWVQMNADLGFPSNDQTVSVRGRLLNASFAEIDTGLRTDLNWSTQGNFVREILAEERFTGSLTVPQAAQLELASSSVVATMDIGTGTSLVSGVSQLLVHPPIGALRESLTSELLTGRGSLTRPLGPINVAAFGALLTFFTIPAGFGFRDGVVLEYYERIIQLATTHEPVGIGREILTEVLDLHTDGFTWLWSNALPRRVLYDVTPGCAVLLRWLEI